MLQLTKPLNELSPAELKQMEALTIQIADSVNKILTDDVQVSVPLALSMVASASTVLAVEITQKDLEEAKNILIQFINVLKPNNNEVQKQAEETTSKTENV